MGIQLSFLSPAVCRFVISSPFWNDSVTLVSDRVSVCILLCTGVRRHGPGVFHVLCFIFPGRDDAPFVVCFISYLFITNVSLNCPLFSNSPFRVIECFWHLSFSSSGRFPAPVQTCYRCLRLLQVHPFTGAKPVTDVSSGTSLYCFFGVWLVSFDFLKIGFVSF